MNQSFPKKYKLCSRKRLGQVHQLGAVVHKYPFRFKIAFNQTPGETPFQIAISVPKRRVNKAHHRNKIKRLIREVLRQNKAEFESFLVEKKKCVSLLLVYNQNQALEFEELNKQIKKSFKAIQETIHQHEKNIPLIA